MKYTFLTLCACILFSGNSFSQKNIEDKSASDVFFEAMFLNYDKKYEEAIEVYQKVSMNDTNYSAAQIEVANCYFYQEDYKNAQDVLSELLDLKLPYSKKHIIYKMLGLAYEKDRQFEKALEVYNKGIALFPFHHGLYSNRGFSYENAEKFTEAARDYKKAILLNPTYAGNHYHLGMLAAHDGMYTEALLSLLTYILLEPKSQRAQEALITIEQISDLSFNAKAKNIDWEEDADNFDKLNQAIKNKTSVDKNVKLKFTIPTDFGNQLHYIFSNSEYQKDNEGFWNQFYLKFYKEIFINEKLDGLVQFALQASIDEDILKKVRKKAAKIELFLGWIQVKWQETLPYKYMEFEGKKQHVMIWYTGTGLNAYGLYDSNNKPIGNWNYYHPNGSLHIKAEFNDENDEHGLWTWYNVYNGNIVSSVKYKNGKANGDAFYYYYTGELSEKRHYRDDELEDTVYSYFRSGDLYEKYTVAAGKKNGDFVQYYENGKVRYTCSFVIGLAQGAYKRYYANGQLSDSFKLVNDKIEGLRTEYYPNGAKSSEVYYKNDMLDGTYKVWYQNGNLEIERNYMAGKQVGKFAEYYSNGILSYDGELDETGKQNGTASVYDYDTKKYEQKDYKKGELIEIRSYNKKGEVFYKASKKGKKLDFVAYYSNGNKRSEGVYLEDVRIGKWEYFDQYGNLESIENYENGYLSDSAVDYFATGAVKSKVNYDYGDRNGLFLKYNIFDTLVEEGIYTDDEVDRDWYYYNSDGQITGEYYYNNGYEQGIQKTYGVNGKISSWKEIELGKVVSQLYLDTNGNKIDQYGQFHGEVKLHDPSNSYVRYKGMFKNGMAEGPCAWYDIDGSVLTEGAYVNDNKNGVWKWYNEAGKLVKEMNYLLGVEDGPVKTYFSDGKISHEGTYVGGSFEGVSKDYYTNGAVSIESNYVNDKKHGKTTYFDQFGNIIMIRNYDKGIFISYSYLDQNGKEVEPIKLTTGNNHIVTYFKNGTKASEHDRKNGLIEGNYIEYNINGKIISEEMYYHGVSHGPIKEYDENGVLIYEANNKVDELHGIAKKYYSNGKIKSEMPFKYDERHGEYKEYSVDGKLVKTVIYVNDDAVKLINH